MVKYRLLILLALFSLGIIFRLWFITLNPLPIEFDQEEYYRMSQSILASGWHTYSYRLYGYPAFIACIYRIFGNNRDYAWRFIQAVLDSLSAILIYAMGRKIFDKEMPAFLGSILYLFNPFTSAFVGVMLTEVLTIFMVTLVFCLFLTAWQKKNMAILVILPLILGYIPQVRPSFLFFTIGFLIIYMFNSSTWKEYFAHLPGVLKQGVSTRLFVILASIFLYILPFFYNVLVNWRNFGQLSFLTADNLFVREFYLSLFVERDPPENGYTKEAHGLYREYSTPTTIKGRKEMAEKYLNWGIVWITKNPKEFVFTRIRKLWFVWDKPYVFPYNKRPEGLIPFVYWANIGLLGVSLIGLVSFLSQKKTRIFAAFYILLLIHITFLHVFSVTDSRFSLPAYPLIFMFAGFGISRLVRLFAYR